MIEASAQRGLDAPMTKAVMNVYQQLLDEDPADYETYYHRACEYYKHNQYNLALSDINNALKYVPASETSQKVEYLILRANIYQQMQRFEDALDDLNNAYNINPNSYIVLYQKANLEFQLQKYTEAKNDYQRMQRINNRSQEALIGLARIAVKENNLGLANEYIDQAVAINSSNSDIYIRRASVRSMMGNDNGAVDDLILAISTDNTNTRALQELVKLSNTNYPSVMAGLSNAIRQAPKVGMFYYIRGVIAENHHNYLAALSDYKRILDENLYNYSGIYNSIAKCQYALGNYHDAIDNIDEALSAAPSNKEYLVTKAKIKRALGDSDQAIEFCNRAIEKAPDYNDALIVKALAMVDMKKYDEATALLGEAALNDADNSYLYILRAWILDNHIGKKSNALFFYNRAIDVNDPLNIKSYHGFAFIATNQSDKAEKWMSDILNNLSSSDGYEYYIATCFYAQKGNFEEAFNYMKRSLESGYANLYDWTINTDGNVNVAPIRNNSEFNRLLEQYSIIFR